MKNETAWANRLNIGFGNDSLAEVAKRIAVHPTIKDMDSIRRTGGASDAIIRAVTSFPVPVEETTLKAVFVLHVFSALLFRYEEDDFVVAAGFDDAARERVKSLVAPEIGQFFPLPTGTDRDPLE